VAAPLLEFDRVAIHLGGREILSPTSFAVARGVLVIENREDGVVATVDFPKVPLVPTGDRGKS